MKYLFMFWCAIFLFSAAEFGLSTGAYAHGTGNRVLEGANTVTVLFFYLDETPMSYAEVLVFSPTDQKAEYQNGRTDKNGIFAFLPDAAGKWLIKADDGMGHASQAFVEVKAEGAAGAQKATEPPPSLSSGLSSKALKVVAGLSLILNLSLAGLLIRKRKNAVQDSR